MAERMTKEPTCTFEEELDAPDYCTVHLAFRVYQTMEYVGGNMWLIQPDTCCSWVLPPETARPQAVVLWPMK
jgi:hypothetical protein